LQGADFEIFWTLVLQHHLLIWDLLLIRRFSFWIYSCFRRSSLIPFLIFLVLLSVIISAALVRLLIFESSLTFDFSCLRSFAASGPRGIPVTPLVGAVSSVPATVTVTPIVVPRPGR
jgi:hypothetical protein